MAFSSLSAVCFLQRLLQQRSSAIFSLHSAILCFYPLFVQHHYEITFPTFRVHIYIRKTNKQTNKQEKQRRQRKKILTRPRFDDYTTWPTHLCEKFTEIRKGMCIFLLIGWASKFQSHAWIIIVLFFQQHFSTRFCS